MTDVRKNVTEKELILGRRVGVECFPKGCGVQGLEPCSKKFHGPFINLADSQLSSDSARSCL